MLEVYLPVVYRFAFCLLNDHHAAEDVAQDVMLRAWRGRRHLRKAESGKTWLLRITSNRCRDLIRRRRHAVDRAVSAADDLPASQPSPLADAIQQEQVEVIRAGMLQLPARQREVLFLRSLEGLRYQEIAEVTGMSLGHVKIALSRARGELKRLLGKTGVIGDEHGD